MPRCASCGLAFGAEIAPLADRCPACGQSLYYPPLPVAAPRWQWTIAFLIGTTMGVSLALVDGYVQRCRYDLPLGEAPPPPPEPLPQGTAPQLEDEPAPEPPSSEQPVPAQDAGL